MWEAIAGAGASAAGSYFGGKAEEGGQKDMAAQLKKMLKFQKKVYAQQRKDIGEFKSGLTDKKAEVKEAQEPWRVAGRQALGRVRQGMAEGRYGPGEFQFSFEDFQQDPSYQFRFDEQMRGLEQAGAARGKRLSGEQIKALQDRSGDLASQEYGNAYQRAIQEHQLARQAGMDEFGREMQVSGFGERADQNYANAIQGFSGQELQALGMGNQAAQNFMSQQSRGMQQIGQTYANRGRIKGDMYRDIAGAANQGMENYLYQTGTA